MIIVGHDEFGKRIANLLDIEFIQFEKRIFPDGEACPRVLDDVEKDVLLVNHMSLPIEPNRYFIETLLLIKNLQVLGAENIDVLMPYFVYSRQDKVFRNGEPFSAKFVLETLQKSGVRNFFTVSSHAERHKDMLEISKIPAHNINGFMSIGNYLTGKKFSSPIVIGPDDGAEFFAKTVSEILHCDYCLLEKERDLNTGKLNMVCNENLTGRNAIIVDDIISSGGTMLNAIELCKKSGAESIDCYIVHCVSEEAITKISPHVNNFLSCDTIDTQISKISVINEVAEKIKISQQD